jgi:tRNA A-37 threonylcarbamoyl transferase component Bud32
MNEIDKLTARVEKITGWKLYTKPQLVTDTSDWMDIKRGDIVRLAGHDFIIKGNRHETRFGIGEQPKYWVFSAQDMETGAQKIIKTEFDEDFMAHIGIFKIHCYRSPKKEAKVLEIVKDDMRFMQGYMLNDEKGNNVRIIDFIKGDTLFNYIYSIKKEHEQYFHEDLPLILYKLVDTIEAIQFLHEHNTCHGDIRNDHIIIEKDTGLYRWIDFDLNQNVSDFDMWSIGNILNYAVGKGINSFQQILKSKRFPENIKKSLRPSDASAFYEYRVINLKKLFPYIPDSLNNILLHFTIKPRNYYLNMSQMLEDYMTMLEKEFPLR